MNKISAKDYKLIQDCHNSLELQRTKFSGWCEPLLLNGK